MIRPYSILLTYVLLLVSAFSAQTKPNTIDCYPDDHGDAELGVNGFITDIKTPNIEAGSQAAAAIIKPYKNDPFFLYIAYRAPHPPLDAPKSYSDRFPGEVPERRRQAFGMISAVEDGVGPITTTLKKLNLTECTLIFLIGDSGAPLKIHKVDAPLNALPAVGRQSQ